VARKDGEGYHDVSIVSAVCKPEMIAQRIIKKLVRCGCSPRIG
jgi:hypothetical protein